MKLKIENGNAVLQDGLPVYIHDDGKEIPFDAGGSVNKINNLMAEKDRHWNKSNELKTQLSTVESQLKKFEGIDPEQAKSALDIVKNLDAKKLIDAGEVEKVKSQLSKIYDDEKGRLISDWTAKEKDYTSKLNSANSTIHHLKIGTEFAKSDFFNGQNPKTVLPPDFAIEYFGKHFKVEGEGPSAKIVGYLNDNKILSRKNIGELANFDEAIATIIDAYPGKDRILNTISGGSGSKGSSDRSGAKVKISRNDQVAFNQNIEKIAKGEVEVID